MKYMIMLHGSQQHYDAMAGKASPGKPSWSQDDLNKMFEFMNGINAELEESGELVAGEGLSDPVNARRIQARGGEPVVTDGPYPETTEVLAGFWIVDCASFDRATEIAAKITKCPAPVGWPSEDEKIDVRPILSEGPSQEA